MEPPSGAEWCRAYHSWAGDPSGATVIECGVTTSSSDLAARAVLDFTRALAGIPWPNRYSREVIGGRFVVNKYWSGTASSPEFEVRVVESPDGGVMWSGAVLPGKRLEASAGDPPPQEPVLPEPPSRIDPPPAPRGQKVIRKPPIYAAEGIPSIPSDPVIELGYYTGEGPVVEASISPLDLARSEARLDFHCVTGWSVSGVEWLGVPLLEVLEGAGLDIGDTRWLLALSWGGYTTIFPFDKRILETMILVVGEAGRPLRLERGWPARLTSPVVYGWKHAKWLRGLYLGEDYVDGFWEARGYHQRGLVVLEERFKDLRFSIGAS